MIEGVFEQYLARWNLEPDGEPITTQTSRLLPVRSAGRPAMLKIVLVAEEKRGGRLLQWWAGQGAARVLAHDDGAVLMERARPGQPLGRLARDGRDDEASRVLCAVAAKLHAPRPTPPPDLVPLERWFEPLRSVADGGAAVLRNAAKMAAELLTVPREVTVLHGDLHHDNVLDFGERGWLAIDPKGLVGERYFDYANLFSNPDAATATKAGRLARQIEVVASAAHLERGRLLKWIVAWTGLSAAFQIEDGLPADAALAIAELAAGGLRG